MMERLTIAETHRREAALKLPRPSAEEDNLYEALNLAGKATAAAYDAWEDVAYADDPNRFELPEWKAFLLAKVKENEARSAWVTLYRDRVNQAKENEK